jgi:hypothetical protein
VPETTPDTSGDYGYDLAHEQTGGGRLRDNPARPARPGPEDAPGTVDLKGDYGYDSAHDFRR